MHERNILSAGKVERVAHRYEVYEVCKWKAIYAVDRKWRWRRIDALAMDCFVRVKVGEGWRSGSGYTADDGWMA